MALRRQKAIAISFAHNSGYKGLLLHPRLSLERTGNIVQIPDFIPLICRKRNGLDEPIPAGRHSTIDAQSCRLVTGQVAVVAVEAYGLFRLCYKGLHLHIGGRHKRPGHLAQIDALIPLVYVVSLQAAVRSRARGKTRLCHQRRFELERQLLAPFPRSPENTQAGCPA